MVDFLFQSVLYLIYATYCILLPLSTQGARLSLLFTASIPRDLSVPMFHGNEAGIVPRFPSNIKCDKFGHFQHEFFNIVSYYLNCLAISRFSYSPWDLEAKSWDLELIPQTVSLTVKPWELAGLPSYHHTLLENEIGMSPDRLCSLDKLRNSPASPILTSNYTGKDSQNLWSSEYLLQT